jgi:hypothetical protein
MKPGTPRQSTAYAVVTTGLLALGMYAATMPWHELQYRQAGLASIVHSGLDHIAYGGDLLLYGAAALHILALLAWRRARLAAWLGVGATGFALGAVLFVEDVWLGSPHVWSADEVVPLVGQYLFLAALFAYVLTPGVRRLWRIVLRHIPFADDGVRVRTLGDQVLAGAGASAAAVAVLGCFLPWHDVHGISGGIGAAFVFAPDYHPDLTPTFLGTCTGMNHGGKIAAVPLLALLGLELALLAAKRAVTRRRLAFAAFVAALLGAAMAVWLVGSTSVGHLFERTVGRGGDYVFLFGTFACLAVACWQTFRRPR